MAIPSVSCERGQRSTDSANDTTWQRRLLITVRIDPTERTHSGKRTHRRSRPNEINELKCERLVHAACYCRAFSTATATRTQHPRVAEGGRSLARRGSAREGRDEREQRARVRCSSVATAADRSGTTWRRSARPLRKLTRRARAPTRGTSFNRNQRHRARKFDVMGSASYGRLPGKHEHDRKRSRTRNPRRRPQVRCHRRCSMR